MLEIYGIFYQRKDKETFQNISKVKSIGIYENNNII
jgi:hypothetical protein